MKDERRDGKAIAAEGRVHPRGQTKVLGFLALLFAFALVLLAGSRAGVAAGGLSTITVKAFELNGDGSQGDALSDYTFIVNLDNSPDASNPDPKKRPGFAPIPSHSPLLAVGDQDNASVTLPDNEPAEKYLISIRSPDHKMWGKFITLPQDNGEIDISLKPTPLPLGKIIVQAFQDNGWTNGAPDFGEPPLEGFHVTLEDQMDGQLQSDYFGNPLCTNYERDGSGNLVLDEDGRPVIDADNPGGDCKTDADGLLTIPNLGPATYFVYMTPPDGSDWTQTTTIDGGFPLLASVTENDDGLGAPGEANWEGPGPATAYWYGFVHKDRAWANPGTGSISGTARNWVGFPPFDTLSMGDPVSDPLIALSNATTDLQVWVGRGDSDGNFAIPAVPAGTYNMAIWDEQLSYIIRFVTVTVGTGQNVDLGDVGVSRWFGWLSGYVYQDTGIDAFGNQLDGQLDANGNPLANTAGNGVRDCTDLRDWTTCEPGIPNFDLDQRWRDGSIKEDTFTAGDGDPHGPGYYEYPTAEGGPLGKFVIGEVGFGRFGTEPGPSVHDETDPTKVTHVCADPPGASPNDCLTSEGGGLLTNQLLSEGHRAWVDWGKRPYEPTETGQIVGITYFATTRNEFFGDTATNETYEAAIPDVEVRLESPGPDELPGTPDDVVVNDYLTDHWTHPSDTTDGQTCDVVDVGGNPLTDLNDQIAPKCLEVPINGVETKDGAFDGGYAFADYCPESTGGLKVDAFLESGGDTSECVDGSEPVALHSGTYITHAVMPTANSTTGDTRPCNPDGDSSSPDSQHKYISGPFGNEPGARTSCLYRPEREEDVNVDSGSDFIPAIPPPPCIGDDHLIDQSTLVTRSPYYGVADANAPLCDKKLIVLEPKQNANADFFLMTNFQNGPDVETPGRLVGSVFDDIYFDHDPKSIWYGEPRALANIPIGIYDYNFRLLTTLHTDENGAYQAMLPSTETFNCPIPQGPCPGMYIAIVDDPGSRAHPNLDYNPNYLTANTSFDIWPGQTDQLDTPLDPISGTGCELATGTPELLEISQPVIGPTGSRQIVIRGASFGSTAGTILLSDSLNRGETTKTLTTGNGGISAWADRQITINVPAVSGSLLPTTRFLPGPKQLMIRTAGTGGLTTPNGITIHVRGSVSTLTGTVVYNPTVVTAAGPGTASGVNKGHELQVAIDSASAAGPNAQGVWPVVVLSPGVYRENVIMYRPLKLQGLGPGGVVGFAETGGPPADDPRTNIQGTTINGEFFRDLNAPPAPGTPGYWDQKLNSLTFSGNGSVNKDDVSKGADITVVAMASGAQSFTSATGLAAARIDGIAITLGQGSIGAGGLQVNAYGRNLQVTNNVFESDKGQQGGAIDLGEPLVGNQHNENVMLKYDRVMGSGGFVRGGGLTIFNGADSYDVGNSTFCSNFSQEYGAGISHFGSSPNGTIHDNLVYYNDAFDSGGGIAIQQEPPLNQTAPGAGSGAVSVDRNIIEANYSGDDGGGIFVLDTQSAPINLRNNMIVNNGAADLGGGILLDDAFNVRIINNTIAENAATASSEGSDGLQHGGGLTSEATDPVFGTSAPRFSNPVALFNNIFWNNEACTVDKTAVPPTLAGCNGELNDPAARYLDFEIHGTTTNNNTFTNARYNLFTNGSVLQSNGVGVVQLPGSTTAPLFFPTNPATAGNIIGVDPQFVAPFATQFAVGPSRLDPQVASVTIVHQDPPVGIQGDYHLTSSLALSFFSGSIDHGVHCSNASVPPPVFALTACVAGGIEAPTGANADIGGQLRPQLRTFIRTRTPWDLGADEVPTFGANQ